MRKGDGAIGERLCETGLIADRFIIVRDCLIDLPLLVVVEAAIVEGFGEIRLVSDRLAIVPDCTVGLLLLVVGEPAVKKRSSEILPRLPPRLDKRSTPGDSHVWIPVAATFPVLVGSLREGRDRKLGGQYYQERKPCGVHMFLQV